MKKILFIASLVLCTVFSVHAQVDNPFTSVPIVNGKIVFNQLIPTEQGSEEAIYSVSEKWVKANYAPGANVTGLRFNAKEKSISVGTRPKINYQLNGEKNAIGISYRLDIKTSIAGVFVVIRDINYFDDTASDSEVGTKPVAAEMLIAPNAISKDAAAKPRRQAIQKSTLQHLNSVYSSLFGQYQ